MSALQEKFNQLITEQEALRKKFQETAQALFKETTKEFFDLNPGVKCVVWTQYTPYFNDGDTCEFGVNNPTFSNAEGSDVYNVTGWGEYDGETEGVWATDNISYVMNSDRDYYKETCDLILAGEKVDVDSCSNFSDMVLSNPMEDVMYAMFGDHVKIIATREGFDVEEYEHD